MKPDSAQPTNMSSESGRLPIRRLTDFQFSSEAMQCVDAALLIASDYAEGSTLFAEHFVFGIAIRGRRSRTRASGYYWRLIEQNALAAYESAIQQHYSEHTSATTSVNVAWMSQDAFDALRGAQ